MELQKTLSSQIGNPSNSEPFLKPPVDPVFPTNHEEHLHAGLFILPLGSHERRDRLHSGRRIGVDRKVAALDPAHRHGWSYTDDLLNIAPGDNTVIASCDAEHGSRTFPQKFSRIHAQQ
jgi:hypothetical protein